MAYQLPSRPRQRDLDAATSSEKSRRHSGKSCTHPASASTDGRRGCRCHIVRTWLRVHASHPRPEPVGVKPGASMRSTCPSQRRDPASSRSGSLHRRGPRGICQSATRAREVPPLALPPPTLPMPYPGPIRKPLSSLQPLRHAIGIGIGSLFLAISCRVRGWCWRCRCRCRCRPGPTRAKGHKTRSKGNYYGIQRRG